MKDYLDFLITGNLATDIQRYFLKYDNLGTYEHTIDVINELSYIKKHFGHIQSGSLIACYCHDLGRVVRSDEILEFCLQNNIMVSDEEKILPSILHQKISCFIAENVFKVNDTTILNAVKYHTTLRKNPSMTEIEVFLADKMSWKEEEYRELAQRIKETLKEGKEKAIYYYLCDLHDKKEKLKLYHSDSKEAFQYFNQNHIL
ncbi:HD domain-containing protein [Alkaliphilus sp. B6464]|uniref:HD domain-containing protein n=1 Tax=Alkaliphilus sp. B6464 TaxID=2731219 RepID=UPI001BAAECD7|nr:HD domain-containing protein [Alkaliphilus sp. B6464]QUH20559.1 HD domain-containing protein [Alkaliphilus sp. B6464]